MASEKSPMADRNSTSALTFASAPTDVTIQRSRCQCCWIAAQTHTHASRLPRLRHGSRLVGRGNCGTPGLRGL
jgi:hypothetical protein